MSYTRFAIYYVPPAGPLAEFGAAWLGWDIALGQPTAQPDVPDLREITQTPRKYGFHATMKPPFRLAVGATADDLQSATQKMASACAPACCEGLQVSALGRFLALTPVGDTTEIARVAAACVSGLEPLRAPATEEELAKRRQKGLSAAQDALLVRWGYPYVMEQFRFHMTLTGRVPRPRIAGWTAAIEAHIPALPAPFAIDTVALAGERPDGHFELIQRYALTG